MNLRKKLLIASVTALVLALVAFLVWHSEPRYDGRSLTDWAIQAQQYEDMALTHRPGYLVASNAIHQMGPAASKVAVDWLVSDARWQRSAFRPGIEKLVPNSRDIPSLKQSQAAAMILSIVSTEARSSVEPRLIAMLVSGTSGFSTPTGQYYWPASVLTNFGAATWSKVKPLLLHTNPMVRMKMISLAASWTSERTMNFDVLWQCRSTAQGWWDEDVLNNLLFQQRADTNRLADAIGSSFLSGEHWARGEQRVAEDRARMLDELGHAGRLYLKTGLTNDSAIVRATSRRFLDR